MTPTFWSRLAMVLSVFNVAGAGFAIASGEGWHAGVHVSLALAFGFAAQRLKQKGGGSELAQIQQQVDEQAIALEEAEATLTNQSKQLAELQERMDFAERLLTQVRDRQTLNK